MIPQAVLDQLIERALLEDLPSSDLTTAAVVSEAAQARARAVAQQPLVVCGYSVFQAVFRRVAPELLTQAHAPEGATVQSGSALWTVSGPARPILMGERTALNFVQRMCGIATLTQQFVAALPKGSKTRIVDTRKTTPGLRALERYAVRCGGGHNHRDNLGSSILIKDNHILAAGGIEAAIAAARAHAPHTSKIEVEVTSLAQIESALAAGAEVVMLDNFSDQQIATAVKQIAGRAFIEVSGGITLARIAPLAAFAVDAISVGALTHSAPATDISLDLELT